MIKRLKKRLPPILYQTIIAMAIFVLGLGIYSLVANMMNPFPTPQSPDVSTPKLEVEINKTYFNTSKIKEYRELGIR